MAAPRRHYLDNTPGQLHVWQWQGDQSALPPIVCLPPVPYGGRFFDSFAQAYDGPVWSADLPGYGFSDALVDPRLGNAPSEYATVNRRNRDQYLCARVANNTLPFLDPPEHNAPRKLITQRFNQYIRRHPPPLQQLADDLLEPLAERDSFDLMQDFATPYAAQVFRHLLDLDPQRLPVRRHRALGTAVKGEFDQRADQPSAAHHHPCAIG